MDSTYNRIIIFCVVISLLSFTNLSLGQSMVSIDNNSEIMLIDKETSNRADGKTPKVLSILSKPLYLKSNDQLLFNWKMIHDISTSTEFRLYEWSDNKKENEVEVLGTPIFSKRLNSQKLLIDAKEIGLKPFFKYAFLVLPSSSSNEEWERQFEAHRFVFTYLPDCTPPKWVNIEVDESSLRVTWERPNIKGVEISYLIAYRELYTNEMGGVWIEKEINTLDEYTISNLQEGKRYEVRVRKVCQDIDLNEISQSEWTSADPVELPWILRGGGAECDQFTGGALSGNDYGILINWSGPAADPYSFSYRIRYRNVTEGETNWTVVRIFQGTQFQVENLVGNHTYEIEMQLIVVGTQGAPDYQCDWLNLGTAIAGIPSDGGGGVLPPEESALEVTLPDFNCGDPFEFPVVDDNSYLPDADTGDYFFIGGFPIKLKEVSGGAGVFSGEGIIPLPFAQKIVRVEFSGVHVNAQYEIFSGSVAAISDSPANYPDLPLEPINLGGPFCVEVPDSNGFDENGVWMATGLPWNPQGFGPGGQYVQNPPYPGYVEGNPYDPNYDPNGYDENGVHVETGTLYNPAGCSQLGIDENGQPCNPEGEGPYYWLNEPPNNPPTEEGINLANSSAHLIKPMIDNTLNILLAEAQDSINSKRIACNSIRSRMETLIDGLGYQRPFIFGPDDEYFAEGMHKNFLEEPKTLDIFLDRNPNEVQLENEHVDLYGCDDTLFIFLEWEKIIIEQQGEAAVTECEARLLDRISTFSEEEVQLYSDSLALSEWVFSQVDIEVSQILQETLGDLGLLPIKNSQPSEQWPALNKPALRWADNDLAPDYSQMWSSLNMEGLDLELSKDNFGLPGGKSLEDISFEFLQGWRYIGGVHRAYYLEAIARGRNQADGMMSTANENLLPIKVSKVVAGRDYTLYLDNIVFTPTGATLDVFFILEIPTSGDRVVFQLSDFSFNPTGGDFVGETSRLTLENEIQIRLSNAAKLNFKPGYNTYVAWDCDGFAGMGVDAEIEFCRNYLLPVDPATMEVIEPDTVNVKAYFTAEMPAWGEFIADLTMDPFAVTQVSDVKWQVHSAKLDFSDSQNASNLSFPDNYNSPFISGSNVSNLWKGFYLESLTATLPNKFDDTEGSKTVGVEKVVIDDMGFTGKAFVASLLDLSQGNLGGWAFSVDTFALTVTTNKLTGAHFNGLVHIPILGKKDGDNNSPPTAEECLAYTAMIESGNNYIFSVSPAGDYYANLWRAGLVINSGSSINITSNPDGFQATAKLNGSIVVDGDFGNGKSINVPDISFENLGLSTQAPYFTAGTWEFPAEVGAEFAGFGITFKDIGVEGNSDEVTLRFGAGLRLSSDGSNNSEDVNISADGYMNLVGELQIIDGRHRWKYKDFNLEAFYLDASFPGVERLTGSLAFYDQDPVYGKGFRGMLDVKFKGIGVGLSAVAQFGKMDTYKYFLVDVLATFKDGIDMGGLQLMGIGGGCYRHMTQSDPAGLPGGSTGTPSLPGLGQSLSGVIYSPSETTGLGFKATAVLATPVKEAFSCNVTLGMEMNTTGGLKNIYFKGFGRFMSDVDVTTPPPSESSINTESKPSIDAVVSAFVSIEYDFENRVLDGNFSTYLNVGDGIIKGSMNDAGKMGQVVLHFSPDEWYINIGTPTERCGIELVVPGIGGGLSLSTYLDVGTSVPDMPPMPSYVREITGASSLGVSSGLRNSGRGFAFGADLSLNTGDLEFLLFYANFKAGLGFDLLLKDYKGTTCSNTNNGKIGINGWYASGQAWAYIQGDIGLRAVVFGQEKRFSILSLGAGVALQAKLPNPFWAQGNVGGYYSVLGGLFEGKCNFQVTVGETCDVIGDPPVVNLPIIDSVTPYDSSTHISTMINPTVNFVIPIKEAYNLDGINHTIELEYVRLKTAEGLNIPGEILMDDYGTLLEYKPYYELEGHTDYVFEVKVNVLKNGTVVDTDEEVINFTTDFREGIIPLSNVKASYPANGQYNFYPYENPDGTGYIILELGQPDLITNLPDNTSLTVLVYKTDGSLAWFTEDISYDFLSNTISFPLRPNLMPNGSVLELQLALVSDAICLDCLPGSFDFGGTDQSSPTRPNIDNSQNEGTSGNINGGGFGGTDGEVATNIDVETNTYYSPEPTVLYQSFFRVSQYDTFKEKMDAFANQHSSTLNNDQVEIIAEGPAGFELFGPLEVGQGGSEDALVKMSAELESTIWYRDSLLDGLYSNFPITGIFTATHTERDPATAQLELREAVDVRYNPTDNNVVVITEEDFKTGDLSRFANNIPTIVHSSAYLAQIDWEDLKKQLFQYIIDSAKGDGEGGGPPSEADYYDPLPSFLKGIFEGTETFPNLSSGLYKINLSYQLPGTGQLTSSFSVDLNY